MPQNELKDEECINWKLFKERILLNKRVWKYICLYSLFYFGSKKLVFNEWYKPNQKAQISVSTAQSTLSNMDQDVQMMENIIGFDSHKPASNVVMLLNQIAHWYLLVYKTKFKYAFNTLEERGDSINPNYKNKDIENHILDVHISVWSFCTFVDAFNCYRKKRINKSDKLMLFHHLVGLLACLIHKYHNNAGSHWAWVAFWSETVGIFSMIGGLLRVIYQKKRPDLVILRNVSDVVFMLHVLCLTYARVFLFPALPQTNQHWELTIMDKYNQYSKLTRLYQLFCLSMSFLGLYWVYESWRVIGIKIIELIKGEK